MADVAHSLSFRLAQPAKPLLYARSQCSATKIEGTGDGGTNRVVECACSLDVHARALRDKKPDENVPYGHPFVIKYVYLPFFCGCTLLIVVLFQARTVPACFAIRRRRPRRMGTHKAAT
ncbi:hypothetical protein PENSPDRAFT_316174 [Peniophora sp. CONT]|nr:hypothetical protein PENSPDRAFT_316174 [Peniophora sp. CONT]